MSHIDLTPTANAARLIPTVDGDYIWVCDTCDHALNGYDPIDAGLDAYPYEVLEGVRQILTKTDGELGEARPVSERSDSTLILNCSCCLRPRFRGQWFTLLLAR